jgi:acyl-coenzyme A thioesterase PaaI-like protein
LVIFSEGPKPGEPESLAAIRSEVHPHCWVCSGANEHGLAMDYREDETGAVEGSFPCHVNFTGYPGFLHGGIVSALLDGAMTNCLMIHRNPGVTADLQVRFISPVLIGKPATVRAWLERSRGPVHILGAELRQDGEVLATAAGKFMSHPDNKKPKQEG